MFSFIISSCPERKKSVSLQFCLRGILRTIPSFPIILILLAGIIFVLWRPAWSNVQLFGLSNVRLPIQSFLAAMLVSFVVFEIPLLVEYFAAQVTQKWFGLHVNFFEVPPAGSKL